MKNKFTMKAIFALSALVLVVGSANAADPAPVKKKTAKKHHTTEATPNSGSTSGNASFSAESAGHTSQRPELGGGAVLGFIGGNFVFGIEAQLMFHFSAVPGLSIGPETGFYHFSQGSGYSGLSVSTNSFPILAAGLYTLPANAQFWKGVSLYAGAAMGLSFTSASVSGTTASGTTLGSASASSTDFVFLVRPGLRFGGDSGHLFYAETMFGTYAGLFAFLPTFGVSFPL